MRDKTDRGQARASALLFGHLRHSTCSTWAFYVTVYPHAIYFATCHYFPSLVLLFFLPRHLLVPQLNVVACKTSVGFPSLKCGSASLLLWLIIQSKSFSDFCVDIEQTHQNFELRMLASIATTGSSTPVDSWKLYFLFLGDRCSPSTDVGKE